MAKFKKGIALIALAFTWSVLTLILLFKLAWTYAFALSCIVTFLALGLISELFSGKKS